MIALYVAGGILALLLVLAFIRGSLVVSCKDVFVINVTARVGGIPLLRLPVDPTRVNVRAYSRSSLERRRKKALKKANKEEKKAKRKQKETDENKNAVQKSKAETILDTVTMITTMVSSLLSRLGNKSRLTVLRWQVTVATKDAATTAITYGAVTAATEMLFSALDDYTRFSVPRTKEPLTAADFTSERSHVDISLRFSMHVWQAVALLIGMAVDFLKYKTNKNRKEDKSHGRK